MPSTTLHRNDVRGIPAVLLDAANKRCLAAAARCNISVTVDALPRCIAHPWRKINPLAVLVLARHGLHTEPLRSRLLGASLGANIVLLADVLGHLTHDK